LLCSATYWDKELPALTRMPYTMKDVARHARVSLSTVSHVLNNTRYTAPDTVQRVLRAVRDLNYQPNPHARRLALSRSDLVGLLVSEIANPFFPEIINGFQQAAWQRGYDMLLSHTENDPARAERAIRNLLASGVRGVAVMSSAVDLAAMERLRAAGIALVFYNFGPAQRLVSNIRIDYSLGIGQLVRYLIELGHREIGIISGPPSNRTAAALQRAMVDALISHGLAPSIIVESKHRVDGGAAAIRTVVAAPTAIMCGNDLIAMGAVSALEELGGRVPKHISIAGFDDIFFSHLVRPPLTTVRIPREDLGRMAFESLYAMTSGKRRKGAEWELPTELVTRKSTAAPRSGALRLRCSGSSIEKVFAASREAQ
jgi:DNA-binding LacI/PurR family transcriptional regulator